MPVTDAEDCVEEPVMRCGSCHGRLSVVTDYVVDGAHDESAESEAE